MSAITTGVTIIGGKNDGSICGLDLETPTPLTLPLNSELVFTHNTGKRPYKINVTNLNAVDPSSGEAYTAYNMNQVLICGDAVSANYPLVVLQQEVSPGVYNSIRFINTSIGVALDVCVQIFWEVNSEELSIVSATGNNDSSTDKNDYRITFEPNS